MVIEEGTVCSTYWRSTRAGLWNMYYTARACLRALLDKEHKEKSDAPTAVAPKQGLCMYVLYFRPLLRCAVEPS